MAIILVQLADIHFQPDYHPALERAEQLGAAVAAEVNADVTTVILALCGDLGVLTKRF